MNKITNIKKVNNFYQISINNTDDYLVDVYFYECLMPYNGKEINKNDLNNIIAFNSARLVLSSLYNKLFLNELSKNEFKEKLENKEINKDNIEIIISFLENEGLLNDLKFIEVFKEKYEFNKGKLAFKKFLESKKISSFSIQNALDDFKEDEDYILDYANKFIKNAKGSSKMIHLKLEANLINKGYTKKTIQKVLNNIEIIDDTNNLSKDYKKYKNLYKNDYHKIVSKLLAHGYNIEDIKKITRKEVDIYED